MTKLLELYALLSEYWNGLFLYIWASILFSLVIGATLKFGVSRRAAGRKTPYTGVERRK